MPAMPPTATSYEIPWSTLATLAPLPALTTPRRKGAARIADIPASILEALNAGRDETSTLVEWLAIDAPTLIAAACGDVGLTAHAKPLAAAARARADLPFNVRSKAIAADLLAVLESELADAGVLSALARHPSDMVRGWLNYAHGFDGLPSPNAADNAATATLRPLEHRLAVTRFFAADRTMSVRECAWDALRPHLITDLPRALRALEPWVRDADANIRRCAIEATRPRGVWCAHLEALKLDPAPALPLLEAVRSDSSRYVLASAANWLNDASKSRPDFVRGVCDRWLRESKTDATAWLVSRALRTLRKEPERTSHSRATSSATKAATNTAKTPAASSPRSRAAKSAGSPKVRGAATSRKPKRER
jgi:3-methyladenine DNA glycosylase AlkC